jgi:serine/threonine protein kinase
MRYVSTGDVRTLLDADGPLPVGRAAAIVAQVASALDAAHAHGLVHRDVKPANMLLAQSADGSSDHVYLSDFGLSKQSLAPTGLTATGQFLGTLDYIAPEQIEGRPVDGRADLYALACATVEMLTGVPPFRRAENVALMYAQLSEPPPLLRERRPELPAAVDLVMSRALAKSPDDRYPGCMDFAAALRAACTPQPMPRTIGDPGFPPVREATELVQPVRADGGAASSPSGSAPPPVAGAPGPAGPSGLAGRAGGQYGATGPSGPGVPSQAQWAAGSGAVQPGASPPASWFRDAPASAGPGPGAPSPWSRDAAPSGPSAPAGPSAPSAPSQWPADPRTGGSPSGQMNWPSDPTSALAPASWVGAPGGPGTYPSYLSGPPHRRRRTGRTVLILLGILILALIVGVVVSHIVSKGSATTPPANLSSSAPTGSTGSTAAGSSAPTSSGPAAAQTPSQVVQAYYQAINEHQYRTAWDLGGKNTHTTYDSYVAGFNGTASDVVEILSVNGNVVTAQLTANQTDGSAKVYAGTYTVTGGEITTFNVVRKS